MRDSTFILGIALASSLLGPLVAQDPAKDAKRLEQLLQQLSGTKPATWKARMNALEQRARAHEAKAKSLRGQAANEAAKATAARAEIERVRKVMALLAPAKPTPKVAAKPPIKNPPGKKPAATTPTP